MPESHIVNEVMGILWPGLTRSFKTHFEEHRFPKLKKAAFNRLTLVDFDLGTSSPVFGPFRILSASEDAIIVESGFHFDAPVNIFFDVPMTHFQITRIIIAANISAKILMSPDHPDTGGLAGISFYSLDCPKVNLEFNGFFHLLEMPSITRLIKQAIVSAIADFSTYPNNIFFSLGPIPQETQIRAPPVVGILLVSAVHVHRQDLAGHKIYVTLRCAAKMCESEYQEQSSELTEGLTFHQPFNFFVYDRQQTLTIRVYIGHTLREHELLEEVVFPMDQLSFNADRSINLQGEYLTMGGPLNSAQKSEGGYVLRLACDALSVRAHQAPEDHSFKLGFEYDGLIRSTNKTTHRMKSRKKQVKNARRILSKTLTEDAIAQILGLSRQVFETEFLQEDTESGLKLNDAVHFYIPSVLPDECSWESTDPSLRSVEEDPVLPLTVHLQTPKGQNVGEPQPLDILWASETSVSRQVEFPLPTSNISVSADIICSKICVQSTFKFP